MAVIDLFSKRQKRASGEVLDVFQYEFLSEQFRTQVIHVVHDAFALHRSGNSGRRLLERIYASLCREYGVFVLESSAPDLSDSLIAFFLNTADTEKCLDWIELTFSVLESYVKENPPKVYGATITPKEAVHELNARLLEHAIGYQYESGKIVRVDSRMVHQTVVKPVLHFLSEAHLAGANQEFLHAHEHYRAGRKKECVADCLKAFESTMKAICDRRKWSYGANDTAKALIDVLFRNKLVPDYLQSEFAALRTVLESGVPTLRNRTSGHGQGTLPVELPAFLSSYVLHLTASTILFLCEADKNLT